MNNKFKIRNRGADAKYVTWTSSLNDQPPAKLIDIPSRGEKDIQIADLKWARDWDLATLTIVSMSVNDKPRKQEFLISDPTIPEISSEGD